MNIGTVKSIIGVAVAKDANGVERILRVGDEIALGESVVTQGIDSKAVIGLEGGKELVVQGSDLVKIDQSVSVGESFGNESIAEVAALQQALLQGQDIADLGETAAGEGAQGTGQLNDSVFDESGHESNVHTDAINFHLAESGIIIEGLGNIVEQEKATYTIVLTSNASVTENNAAIYTASIYDAAGNLVNAANNVTVTLSNGQTITILAGQSSGTWSYTQGDDVYIDPETLNVGITGISEVNAGTVASMGNFTFGTGLVTTQIVDTIDNVKLTLHNTTVVEADNGVAYNYRYS